MYLLGIKKTLERPNDINEQRKQISWNPTTTVLEVLCDEKSELRMRGLSAQLVRNSFLVDDPSVAQDQSAAKLRTSEPSCQSNKKLFSYLPAVLRIRDILVRIRIRGSVPLLTDPDQWPSRRQLKLIFLICLLITFCSYIYIIFKR